MDKKLKYLIGIDEVGRGPLAGPVCVGAVMVPRGFNLRIFKSARDSKKMTARKREECFEEVKAAFGRRRKESGCCFAVSFVSAKKIDSGGLSPAINGAIADCLKKLKAKPKQCMIFLDGALRAPSVYKNQKTIIRGDDKEKIISLASIVAKVSRDKLMTKLSLKHPAYKFHKHKGYGTSLHRALIKKHGPSPLHRQTFLTNILKERGVVK